MFVREAEADANFQSRKNYSIEREKKTMEIAIMFEDVGESILWRGNACT